MRRGGGSEKKTRSSRMRVRPRNGPRRGRDRRRSGCSRRRRRTAELLQRPGGVRPSLADLCGGCGRRVLVWWDSHDVERRRPRVKGPVQLADPLIVPASHDGLAGRMLRRRVVKAPLGAALGVTTIPGRGIDREDEGPSLWTVRHQQRAQPILVDAAAFERLVEAAVRTAEHRLEAEGGHRGHR